MSRRGLPRSRLRLLSQGEASARRELRTDRAECKKVLGYRYPSVATLNTNLSTYPGREQARYALAGEVSPTNRSLSFPHHLAGHPLTPKNQVKTVGLLSPKNQVKTVGLLVNH